MLGSKISNALENINFAVIFMYLKLRREQLKEDYMAVGERKAGIRLQDS